MDIFMFVIKSKLSQYYWLITQLFVLWSHKNAIHFKKNITKAY